LGVSGQGRLDPIEAAKRNTNKSFNNMDRPGLGLNVKKKHKKNKVKNKKTAENREEQVDMFGFMDTLLSSNQSNVPEKISTPSSSAAIPSTDREANRSIAKIQSKIESTQVEYNSAAAAVRRNKGKPMESQFQAKLEKVAKLLADLKNEANTMKGHVKRRRERESMHTF
jgi:hypothetical protein